MIFFPVIILCCQADGKSKLELLELFDTIIFCQSYPNNNFESSVKSDED